MSLLENHNLNYLTRVEQYFLSLKDSGLALSASDYHLIGRWEARGVPEALLLRAIDASVARFRKQSRHPAGNLSLARLADDIEDLIQRGVQ